MRDLGTLPGDYSSSGSSINNLSQIVGQSLRHKPNCRGFLWQNGKMVDLSTLLPQTRRYPYTIPVTIDDLGVIGGFGIR